MGSVGSEDASTAYLDRLPLGPLFRALQGLGLWGIIGFRVGLGFN